MKRFLVFLLLAARAIAQDSFVGVYCDEATGSVLPISLESRIASPADAEARASIEAVSNMIAGIEASPVSFGTSSSNAFRGDWGLAASNLSASAYSVATGAEATAEAAIPAIFGVAQGGVDNFVYFDKTDGVGLLRGIMPDGGVGGFAYDEGRIDGQWDWAEGVTIRGSRTIRESTLSQEGYSSSDEVRYISPLQSLPVTLSTNGAWVEFYQLAKGATRISISTTNSENRSSGNLHFSHNGTNFFSMLPSCDGAAQVIDFPLVLYPTNEGIRITLSTVPSPFDNGPPTIIAAEAWTLADLSLAEEPFWDTSNQRVGGDYPTLPRQFATKLYVDDAADAAFDLSVDEIAHATFDRDLATRRLRWSPRIDTYAAGDSWYMFYGGGDGLAYDGTGASVVPRLVGVEVLPSESLAISAWSYTGGAANLIPEVCTNLTENEWVAMPECIVSATNTDEYTARVVVSNCLSDVAFIRLRDMSSGDGEPVFRVRGGIEFGGVVKYEWPEGGVDGTGSGFPLTTNADAGGFAITNSSLFQAAEGDFCELRAGTIEAASITATDFSITGTMIVNQTINMSTTVYMGVSTTYIAEVYYATQYLALVAYTNLTWTNQQDTYVNVGGSFAMGAGSTFMATGATRVEFPYFSATSTGGVVASGPWHFDGPVTGIDGTTNILSMGAGSSETNKVLRPSGVGNGVEWADPPQSGGATNIIGGTYDAGTRTLTPGAEADPLSLHKSDTNAIGAGLAWDGNKLYATGEGAVTNEVDPSARAKRDEPNREYELVPLVDGTATVSAAHSRYVYIAATTTPVSVTFDLSSYDAADIVQHVMRVDVGTNTLTFLTNGISGQAYFSTPASSTNHFIFDRYPGDAVFQGFQVIR